MKKEPFLLKLPPDYLIPKLSDFNPPALTPPARGGGLSRYTLPLDGGGSGRGWGCLIINSTSSVVILLRIAQFRL
jgi:hypothetical protein